MEIFDISQTLEEGIAVWPGDPEFTRRPVLKVAEGASSNVSEIRMGTHTGTHIDAPLHVEGSGNGVATIPIQSLIGPARVIQFAGDTCLRAADLLSMDWHGVERVLFRTRLGVRSEGPLDSTFIYLHEDAAEFLAGKGILLVGTDAPSVDPFGSVDLPAHKVLLRHEIVILESAQLSSVNPGDYNLACLPLKIAGADGSPARAILWR